MKKELIISILMAIVLTAALFWHEYKYDIPSTPYTTEQYVTETLIGGTFFITCFSVLFYAAIRGVNT